MSVSESEDGECYENDVFNGRTSAQFSLCVKFLWASDNHTQRVGLVYDLAGGETSVVSNSRQKMSYIN